MGIRTAGAAENSERNPRRFIPISFQEAAMDRALVHCRQSDGTSQAASMGT
jgi:hypothetical protein